MKSQPISSRLKMTAQLNNTIEEIIEIPWRGDLLVRTKKGMLRRSQPFVEFIEDALRRGCTVEILSKE